MGHANGPNGPRRLRTFARTISEQITRRQSNVRIEQKFVSNIELKPGKFHGGTILGIRVTVEKLSYEALEQEAQRMMMHD